MGIAEDGGKASLLNDGLRHRIADNLGRFAVQYHDGQGMRRAAVALAVVDMGRAGRKFDAHFAEAALVLTRRSTRLSRHAGQWALPGGRIDEGESAEQTALRELEEEVGLVLESDAVLGRLDDFTTRSGFTISPVVVWGGPDPAMMANPAEVDSIHRLPFRELQRRDAPLLQTIPESDDPVLLMPFGRGYIATPTGAILYQFREVALEGRLVRVDHYEQPYFAWQ